MEAPWFRFAPITTQVHRVLGVSEGAVGDLAGIEPLMYVLLAIPTGRWTDRGFRSALSAGALFTASGAILRLVDPTSYEWVFAGQFVVSIGQPLVLNSTTKIAARYFRLIGADDSHLDRQRGAVRRHSRRRDDR